MSEVAVFDLSDRVKVELTGRDVPRFLHNLCTNDIVPLQPGRGIEAFFCTAKAKVIFHAVVWNLSEGGEPKFWIDAGPGPSDRVVKHLDRHLISERLEIADRTADFAQYRVVGSDARTVVAGLVKGEVSEATDFRHTLGSLSDGTPCHVFAQHLLNMPVYDLVCPRGTQPLLGATFGDVAQYELLRVEAGLPELGKDVDENRFVAEVGRTAQAISYNKGCYLGQEPVVMARDRGHVNRFLVGLKLAGETLAAPGAKVLHGDRDVGVVTSSVRSPRFGPIALAYVWRGSHEPGTTLRVQDRDATVTALPFA